MKKILIVMIAVFGLSFSGFSQYADGGEYMGAITGEYKKIQQDMWDYTNAASHGKSAKTVEKKRAELVQTTYAAKGKVSRMKGYENNTSYRDSVVSFLDMYYKVLKEDYAEIVDMEEIAEQSYDLMEAYMLAKEGANNKLSEASEMLSTEQEKFAKEFDIELVSADDDLSKKMAVADEVYSYYNVVYLIFFKSYIQDVYLNEAIAKGDVSAIEQNKSALSMTAEEGLGKLKGLTSYNGDFSVVQACQKVLRFYQDEADQKVKDITNYFLKSENFKTIQKSFDQKKEKDRTQADVDQFNAAVNESNAAMEKYNEVTEFLNKGRADNLDNWNRTVSKFTDKHVPKGGSK
ncbi:MAG: hypothetical protein ACI857_000686 [Arenicella sp.]|jgi:hypothetical protein